MADSLASLEITAELENLGLLRRFIQQTAAGPGVNQPAIDDVILAANEVVTNIILHGYRNQAGKIWIDLDREEDALVIYLRDRAPPFDPTTVPVPDLKRSLSARPLGKMGVYLMRQLVDTVSYRTLAQGGNELRLVKKGVWREQKKRG